MKIAILGLLLFLSFTLSAQNGLTILKPISDYKAVELRCQTGVAIDDTGRLWLSFSGLKLGPTYFNSNIGLLTLGSDSTWKKIRLDSVGGPKTEWLSSIQFLNHGLWLGSDKGLIRKKGSQFKLYKNPAPNLPGDTVNNFSIKGNTYYLAQQNGLHICYDMISGQSWNAYDTTNSTLPTNKIYGVDVALDGICWLATDKGVVRFDPFKNESRLYNHSNSEFITDTILSIKVMPNGDVWAGAKSFSNGNSFPNLPGLFKLKSNQFENIFSLVGICDYKLIPLIDFNQLFADGNDIVFTGTSLSMNTYTYTALFKTDGIMLEKFPLFPLKYPILKCFLTKKNNSYFIIHNQDQGLQAKVLNMTNYIEDSTYNQYVHRFDSISNPNLTEIVSQVDINNMVAPIRIKGDLLNTDFTIEKGLRGEKGDCKSIGFIADLWMGGIADGELHVAAGTYRQSGIDYACGPLRVSDAGITDKSKFYYNHAWKIEQRTIETFKLNYNKPGYIIPQEILLWPAHGDSAAGYAANLAPFVDLNNNHLYEPSLGDYPSITGQQEVFWIFNDQAPIHSETDGISLGVELHGSSYAYVCDKIPSNGIDKALNNTVFFKYKLINRSNKTYQNFRVGFWMDCSIGNYTDDRLGSNPQEDYAFWYNGDTLDELSLGYGTTLPGAALLMLKGMKDATGNNLRAGGIVSYNNDFSITGNPTRPEQYYNYLCNRWKDSTSITYGGKGKGGNDSNQVFMFPGKNDVQGRPEWTHENSGNPAGNLRIMINSQPITLKPGDEQELEYAIVYTPTNSNDKDYILGELHKDVMKVKGWYAANSFPSCSQIPLGVSELQPALNKPAYMVYPNPASGIINVEMSNGQLITDVYIYAINGALVQHIKATDIKKLDMSSYNQGLYFMQVITKDGMYVKKVVRE